MSGKGSRGQRTETIEEQLERSLGAYDDALASGDEVRIARARLALAQALSQADWEPPEVVVGQMLRDAAVIEQSAGTPAQSVELPDIPRQTRRAVSPVEILVES